MIQKLLQALLEKIREREKWESDLEHFVPRKDKRR